jgi:prefoldin subunit 5
MIEGIEMSDDLNQQIGRLEANVERLHADMAELKADIKVISNSVNRWKGAGAVLVIVGMLLGYVVDLVYRLFDR